MRKYTLLLIISAIIASIIPGFSAQKQQTIVFWYGATQNEQAAYTKMINEFEKENPDIKVKAMLVPQSYVERKLILSVAGGVPPDVVRFYAHLGGELMSRGGLEPLDDLVKKDTYNLKDFYPVGLTQNSYNGKLYGMPWVLSPMALFYNKDLFRKAGLDPNAPPKTWKELYDAAIKLTKKNKNGVLKQVGFADFLYNPNNFTLYLWQSGGDLVSKDGRDVLYNSQEGIFTLNWMKSFIKDEVGSVEELQKFSANFKGATQDPFGQGSIAMRIDSPFRIPDLKKYFPTLNYGIAPVPYNKNQAVEVVGNSLVIPKGSLHKEAAWKFIQFAASAEQVKSVCKAAGRIPARISASKSKDFYTNSNLKPFIDQLSNGKSVPIISGWQECSDKLAREIEKALKNQKSSKQALTDAEKSSEQILAATNEDMAKFAIVPWKSIGLIAGAFLLSLITLYACYVKKHTKHSRSERAEAKQFFLFASPWIIGFLIFTFGSTIASLVISFSKWDTLSPAHFIGARNYMEMFSKDSRLLQSVAVTLYYAVFSIPLAIVGGLAVSVLMNQKVFGIKLFRTIYYLPAVISGVATSVLWQYIFNPSTGLMNKLLTLNILPLLDNGKFHFVPLWQNPPAWLLDPNWSMPAFIIMGFWGVGGAMIVYLAALQGVPEELYEAAKIDGAGSFKSFMNVTLPLLTPAIFYQLVVGTMYSLQMFTQAYIMTGGGPEDSTLFYALYLFKNAFEWMKMGYASAMAWILFIVVLIITIIHFKVASRWVYYEGSQEK